MIKPINRIAAVIVITMLFGSCTSFEIRQLPSDQIFEPGRTEINTKDQGERWGVFQRGSLIPEYTKTAASTFPRTEGQAKTLLKERKRKLLPLVKNKYQFAPHSVSKSTLTFVLLPGGMLLDLTMVPLISAYQYVENQQSKRAISTHDSGSFLGIDDKSSELPIIWFPITRMLIREMIYGPTGWMSFSGIPDDKESWKTNTESQKQLKDLMTEFYYTTV